MSHRNGFVCLFHKDKITNIKAIPVHFTTQEIKEYSDEAIEQFKNAKETEMVD